MSANDKYAAPLGFNAPGNAWGTWSPEDICKASIALDKAFVSDDRAKLCGMHVCIDERIPKDAILMINRLPGGYRDYAMFPLTTDEVFVVEYCKSSESVRCDKCGETYIVGMWPWCPHGPCHLAGYVR